MHISTASASEMVKDVATIAITNKQEVSYDLAYFDVTFAYSKWYGQDHAHLNSEYYWWQTG